MTAVPHAANVSGLPQLAARNAGARRELRKRRWRVAWFSLLVASICLEGLGRRYLRQIPPTAFYFLKDVVLLLGFYMGVNPEVKRVVKKLFGKGVYFMVPAIIWTVLEAFNPLQGSPLLAVVGLRSYWLWWFAPLAIASVLWDAQTRKGAIYFLALVSAIVCAFAVLQFGAPPEADVNTYSVNFDGDPVQAVSIASTGRPRVASTFSFISGFSDYTLIVPPLLLTIGLGAPDRGVRLAALGAAALTGAVLPMSGSRGPLLVGGGLLVIIAWSSGFLFTRSGRRVVFGAIIVGITALTASPEALEGVYDRMAGSDTDQRYDDAISVLPPVALARHEYPWLGIGTGMQQNARAQLGVSSHGWDEEGEAGKHLIELGVPGYLLFWLTRLSLAIALFKASRLLRRAGRGASAGAAIGFSALTFFGNLTFDHIWQALFFLAVGYILLETTIAYRALQAAAEGVGAVLRRGAPAQPRALVRTKAASS